MVIHIGLW